MKEGKLSVASRQPSGKSFRVKSDYLLHVLGVIVRSSKWPDWRQRGRAELGELAKVNKAMRQALMLAERALDNNKDLSDEYVAQFVHSAIKQEREALRAVQAALKEGGRI